MSVSTPALLVAAAGVGFGHAILPDHWAPLAVLGRTRRYPISRVARISALAGVAHVLVSVILGAILVVVGLELRSTIESAESTIVGAILIATGVAFALLEASGRGHGHSHSHDHAQGHDHAHEHEQGHEHDHAQGRGHSHEHDHGSHEHQAASDPDTHGRHRHRDGLLATMIPFGAAASPDLTILPVFLAASAAGAGAALGSLLIFAAVTIGTIVSLTVIASASGRVVRGEWLERWGNVVTAGVLIVIGTLILTGVI